MVTRGREKDGLGLVLWVMVVCFYVTVRRLDVRLWQRAVQARQTHVKMRRSVMEVRFFHV